MWQYLKLRKGYVRSKPMYSADRFMFETLCIRSNRTWWYKLLEYTICKLLSHEKSFLCIEKGYTETMGDFEIVMCGRCRCAILFYERKKDEN